MHKTTQYIEKKNTYIKKLHGKRDEKEQHHHTLITNNSNETIFLIFKKNFLG